MPRPECSIYQLGLVEYTDTWQLQIDLAQNVAQGVQPNTLLLAEHPPVYTMGRTGNRQQVLLNDQELADIGVVLLEVDRGGKVTYHGPGQLVAYPVLDLRTWGGPIKYVRALEQVILKTLADFGITAGLVEGLTGVWIGEEKIAAIGVKISRGVSYHGLALNVSTDLSYFSHIVPCGISDRAVTSMQKLLAEEVEMETVAYSLVYHFGKEMGFRMIEREKMDNTKCGYPKAAVEALEN